MIYYLDSQSMKVKKTASITYRDDLACVSTVRCPPPPQVVLKFLHKTFLPLRLGYTIMSLMLEKNSWYIIQRRLCLCFYVLLHSVTEKCTTVEKILPDELTAAG
jgi:hypothetical protein